MLFLYTCSGLLATVSVIFLQDKRVAKFLSDTPNLTNAGQDVTLTVTTDNIHMVSLESQRTLLHHSMEEISFASGGDSVCLYLCYLFYSTVLLPLYMYYFLCICVTSFITVLPPL